MTSKGNSNEKKWPKYDHIKHSDSRDVKFKAFARQPWTPELTSADSIQIEHDHNK
jgi:hypothetical protein